MIAIISCCGANLASVQYACARLGKKAILTTDPETITAASHVILPGVGTAKQAMQRLQTFQLVDVIINLKQPVLGICLGMQILYEYSAEGEVSGLGILSGKITALPIRSNYTIPHMGWNQLQINLAQSPLVAEIKSQSYVYFAHSYHAPVTSATVAAVHYSVPFSAIIQHKNFYGTQFHPERSGKVGEKILWNFVQR